MRAIDTNILARFVLNDDHRQATLASDILRQETFLSATVLMELCWLLESRYRLPRPVVADVLTALIEMPTVHTERSDRVAWAIARYAAGADFADMLHLVVAADADGFVTFDRAIARQAGPDTPVAVETLG